ncbi:hypothetical protein Sste5346_002169 [Sporothrix stenoceras]|uniref:Beta-lactamase-related domain-containing protein n=1 Tax=Sporothrix stenoceras TaxID=5173 RepID=A0ABR3ZLI6_9PEZI
MVAEDTKKTNAKPTKLLDLIQSSFSASNLMPTKLHIDGLAISKDGETVLEEYFGDMAADALHIISSCTKSITVLLARIAIEQGLFGLGDKIVDYFAGVKSKWSSDDDKLPMLTTDVEQLVLGWQLVASLGAPYNYDNGMPSLIGCLIERTSGIPLVEFANQHLFAPMDITRVT